MGVKKINQLKSPIDVESYIKLKAILKHELSLLKTLLLHTGRDGKEHADSMKTGGQRQHAVMNVHGNE